MSEEDYGVEIKDPDLSDNDALVINEDEDDDSSLDPRAVLPGRQVPNAGTQLRSLLLASQPAVLPSDFPSYSSAIPTETERRSQRKIATRSKTDPEAAAMRRASIGNLIKAIYDPNKPDDFVEDPDVSVLTGEKRRTKSRRRSADSDETGGDRKKKRLLSEEGEDHDNYCWLCSKDGDVLMCDLCPRVFHIRCLNLVTAPQGNWNCAECETAKGKGLVAPGIGVFSRHQLKAILRHTITRMKGDGSEPFLKPVSDDEFPTYRKFVKFPMDLSTLEKNINYEKYSCLESFVADTKWILHNCTIFNGAAHKLTNAARTILKICKHEVTEIENCPECYLNYFVNDTQNWFCEPCSTPHPLVWARLKGYPYWPAKALKEVGGQVDVRFFGEHDRAWVPVTSVYALSEHPPQSVKNKKGGFDFSLEELGFHIKRIEEVFGVFHYAPFKQLHVTAQPFNHVQGSVRRSTPRLNELLQQELANDRSQGIEASNFEPTDEQDDSTKDEAKVTRTASMIKQQLAAKKRLREEQKSGVFTMSDEAVLDTEREKVLQNKASERPRGLLTNTGLIDRLKNRIDQMSDEKPEEGGGEKGGEERAQKQEKDDDEFSSEVEVSEDDSDADEVKVVAEAKNPGSRSKQSGRKAVTTGPGVQSASAATVGGTLTPPRESTTSNDVVAKYSKRLKDSLTGVLEDLFDEVSSLSASKATNSFEMERLNFMHEQHIREIRHNYELTLSEMRLSFERERRRMESDKANEIQVAVRECKKKQWCTQCGKEAIYYCCWNTSYCGFQCQTSHWPVHMTSCTQSDAQTEQGRSDQPMELERDVPTNKEPFVRIAPKANGTPSGTPTTARTIIPSETT